VGVAFFASFTMLVASAAKILALTNNKNEKRVTIFWNIMSDL